MLMPTSPATQKTGDPTPGSSLCLRELPLPGAPEDKRRLQLQQSRQSTWHSALERSKQRGSKGFSWNLAMRISLIMAPYNYTVTIKEPLHLQGTPETTTERSTLMCNTITPVSR